ncbi:MAG: isoleucine--tRNA ligase [Candidatus Saccharimonadales bacterium]
MKFKSGTRRQAIDYEKDLVKKWQRDRTFEKSVEQRPVDNSFVFYDGPPFLTGAPHHGHLLVSTIKDTIGRYQTMQGKRVERVWGWDCHGLPAEVFVENKLGITSKKEIGTKISISDYVKECRAAMVKTGSEWEDTIERLGRWVEFKGAYKTMDKEYMESVWWAFKQLYDKGKIYQGEKILIYCTKDATPISKSEIAMENSYQLDIDPSVYTFFQLEDGDEYVLTWTTTPWTLPANVAVAVNEQLSYSLIDYHGKKFYVASDAVKRVMTDEKHQALDYNVVKNITGKKIIGKKYHPLFTNRGPQAHTILSADFVTAAEGTGIVHEAPAYGEDDWELCKKYNVPIVAIVDENGFYTEGPWQGANIWEVNKEIAKTLLVEGKALKVEYIKHEYPHCHRCGSKLMYRAHPSWFMDIQGQKQAMLKANDTTKWVPDNLRAGRFQNILETAPDWNLSRDRYWATPIPVWLGRRNDGTEVIKVIGSYQEFEQLTGKSLNDYHLPNVMNLEFEYDGTTLKHIGKVLDCWFESGSMPFAQFHYPFQNEAKFERSFPADFITEAIDQTRGWFYSLTAVNVGLFGQSPFKNLICTGFINAADGKKMSKKLGNYTDPIELMDKYSADAFRFLMMSSPLASGENFNLKNKDVADIQRKLAMIWNMYDFFTLYAEVDGWQWDGSLADPLAQLTSPLDQWIVSRIHELGIAVGKNLQGYDIAGAVKLILPFLDDASNWYVRRSRRRFWRESTGATAVGGKSQKDNDKAQAYQTLYYVLVKIATIMAPFTPFLAEELYHNLTGGESVHLLDWPQPGQINELLLQQMSTSRELISLGLSQRAEAGLKVRQPLAGAKLTLPFALDSELLAIVKEELNLKSVTTKQAAKLSLELNKNLTPQLKREGLMREIIRHVQQQRKQAGLKVDDRIKLSLTTSDKALRQAIDEHLATIKSETLARQIAAHETLGYQAQFNINNAQIIISLEKL